MRNFDFKEYSEKGTPVVTRRGDRVRSVVNDVIGPSFKTTLAVLESGNILWLHAKGKFLDSDQEHDFDILFNDDIKHVEKSCSKRVLVRDSVSEPWKLRTLILKYAEGSATACMTVQGEIGGTGDILHAEGRTCAYAWWKYMKPTAVDVDIKVFANGVEVPKDSISPESLLALLKTH